MSISALSAIRFSASSESVQILYWLGILFVAGLVVALIGLFIHRRLSASSEDSRSKQGFTLSELRRMRDSSQLSKEEFDRAKSIVIGQHPTETTLDDARANSNGPNQNIRRRPSNNDTTTSEP